jgi:hypothetical protein
MIVHLRATVDVPSRWLRVVRAAECVFVLTSLLLLLCFPFPPYGRDVVPFVVVGVGSVWAALAWWGLRYRTRAAWWGALILASIWCLNFMRTVVTGVSLLLHGVFVGPSVLGPSALLSYVVAALVAVSQFVVLFAWWRASVLHPRRD